MKKRISAAIVILGICIIFLYAKNAGEDIPAEEAKVQEDVLETEQETEEIAVMEEVEETEERSDDYADEESEEEKKYPDEWEIEYVEALSMPYSGVSQEDINRIGQCRNLKSLEIYIWDEKLDLSPLRNLTELERIELGAYGEQDDDYNCASIDISFLADLTKLEELSFFDVNIKDYSFFYSLHQLRDIYIEANNAIDDLSFFGDMPELESLYLGYVEDVDLSYLANLENIERIDIMGTHIRNVEKLAGLSNMKILSLFEYDGYEIEKEERLTMDLHILDGMEKLASLSLYFINVEDVSPLADKQFLEWIRLTGTGIDDIEPLKNLDKLRWLDVFGNESERVKEQSELYFQDVESVWVIDGLPVEIFEL